MDCKDYYDWRKGEFLFSQGFLCCLTLADIKLCRCKSKIEEVSDGGETIR